MAARYVVAGGQEPWPHSPYLVYGASSKVALIGEVVDDLPGDDIRYLLDAGYIIPESDYVQAESAPVEDVPVEDEIDATDEPPAPAPRKGSR